MKSKLIIIGIIGLLLVLQLFRGEKTNPPVTAEIQTDMTIKSILRNSCYDCHSNETVWPWYSSIAPVSFLVTSDVNKGRRHLNFSTWDNLPVDKKKKKLDEIVDEVSAGEMPISAYTMIHTHAKLDDNQKQMLIDWAKSFKTD